MSGKRRAILLGPVVGNSREQAVLREFVKVRPQDLLVGVDRGTWVWTQWGFKPDLAVGDWDSLGSKKNILKNIPHLSLDPDKDRSDLYYAAQAAIEAGAEELVCLGVTGGRPDHQIAMLHDLSAFALNEALYSLKKVEAHGVDGDYYFLSQSIPQWKQKLPKGCTVSVFAMNREATGVTLKGFRYPLKDVVLQPSSHGLSNRTVRENCEVHLRKGQLLVIIPRDGVL